MFRILFFAKEDFERVECRLHERFLTSEREVLGELLERIDVDAASLEFGGRQHRRVLCGTETYFDGGAAGHCTREAPKSVGQLRNCAGDGIRRPWPARKNPRASFS